MAGGYGVYWTTIINKNSKWLFIANKEVGTVIYPFFVTENKWFTFKPRRAISCPPMAEHSLYRKWVETSQCSPNRQRRERRPCYVQIVCKRPLWLQSPRRFIRSISRQSRKRGSYRIAQKYIWRRFRTFKIMRALWWRNFACWVHI